MNDRDNNLDELLTRIEQREQASKRNVLLWTAIPIAAALALLGYSSWRLATASAEVRELDRIAESYKAQANTAKEEVAGLTVQISDMRAEAATLREQLEAGVTPGAPA